MNHTIAAAVTPFKRRPEIDPSIRAITPAAAFHALHPHLTRRNHPAGSLA